MKIHTSGQSILLSLSLSLSLCVCVAVISVSIVSVTSANRFATNSGANI